MPVRLHIFKDVGNPAIRADHKRGASDSFHFLAIHILFFNHAIRFTGLLLDVGQQGIGQIVLLFELLLNFRRIGRNAQNHRQLLQLLVCIAEPASFNGSTRGIRLGEEKEDHCFSVKILQRDLVSVLVRQIKLRGFIINLHG